MRKSISIGLLSLFVFAISTQVLAAKKNTPPAKEADDRIEILKGIAKAQLPADFNQKCYSEPRVKSAIKASLLFDHLSALQVIMAGAAQSGEKIDPSKVTMAQTRGLLKDVILGKENVSHQRVLVIGTNTSILCLVPYASGGKCVRGMYFDDCKDLSKIVQRIEEQNQELSQNSSLLIKIEYSKDKLPEIASPEDFEKYTPGIGI